MTETQRSLRRTQIVGLALVVVLFLVVFGWGAQAEIAGAIIARAIVAVKSNAKEVQHLEGGIVRRLYVENGDRVSVGSLLIELDDTEVRAAYQIVASQYHEMLAEQARLEAERDRRPQLIAPAALADKTGDLEIARILDSQSRLLASRIEGISSKKQQLREQVTQLQNQIEGIQAQHNATLIIAEILGNELTDLQGLLKKALIPKSRVLALEREAANVNGEAAQFKSEIARLRGKIIEIDLKILQVDEDWRTVTLDSLTNVRTRVAALQEQVLAARVRLDRIVIRAPQSGIVHELAVHTEGGVLAPGSPAMLIIPEDDELVIRANVRPEDIDQVSVGQTVRVRIAAFNQRTMPEIFGAVVVIGADLSVDEATRLPYYLVDIAIPPRELQKLEGQQLKPGMPAETFIQTQQRTVLSYFMKPLSEQIARAFRD